jgi:predicted ArsR family transcriptional regulator
VGKQAEEIGRVALLDEPTRRRLYEYVVGRGRPVGRDEAAAAAGISRGLAAFHLDRLAEAGLLEAEYRRISGRTGRGAGRPAKLYRVGARRVEVSVPENRYALAGRVLARSVRDRGQDESGEESVRRSAQQRGLEMGRRMAGRGRSSRAGAFRRAGRALDQLGYQPELHRDLVQLHNCPFHALVQESRDLVCSLNHALLSGLVEGLGIQGVVAEVDPEPVACCVRLRATPA